MASKDLLLDVACGGGECGVIAGGVEEVHVLDDRVPEGLRVDPFDDLDGCWTDAIPFGVGVDETGQQ